MVSDIGAVKTSNGGRPTGGATVHAVRLMKRTDRHLVSVTPPSPQPAPAPAPPPAPAPAPAPKHI